MIALKDFAKKNVLSKKNSVFKVKYEKVNFFQKIKQTLQFSLSDRHQHFSTIVLYMQF